ncbi:MAG: thrombospondin type 3 repeat-containing protein [Myxococcota bacterium]
MNGKCRHFLRAVRNSVTAAVVLAFLLALPTKGRTQSIQLQLFEPAVGSNNFFVTHSSELIEPSSLEVALQLMGAQDLLAVGLNERESADLVESRGDVHFGLAYRPLSLLEVSARASIGFAPSSSQEALSAFGLTNDDVSSVVVGDLHVEPKIRLLNVDEGVLALALIPTVVVPVDDSAFGGERGVVFHPKLAVSHRHGVFHTALNVGYRLRERGVVGTLVQDDEVVLRGAAAVRLFGADSPFEMVADVFAHLPATDAGLDVAGVSSSDLDAVRRSAELALGAKWFEGNWGVRAGAGFGLTDGYGSPTARVFASVSYRTTPSDDAGVDSRAVATRDSDGDGIADEADRCPDDPEDVDGVEDADGCPDVDDDGDGIENRRDRCPAQPEDFNGQADEDGCPDGDQDLDGITDAADRCPQDLEDVDGFEDEDGCPDLDNDGDGILDAFDKCPLKAEDKDGRRDKDGCPE